jgi:hypothetical protein
MLDQVRIVSDVWPRTVEITDSDFCFEQIIDELPAGAKLATKTCYGCWKVFACVFVVFLLSIFQLMACLT